jgi:DNA-binding transcriptional regulator YdaS (Cro superfamily)
MTLDTYLHSPGAMSLTDLSAAVGISKGRLSQLRHSTELPPELALKIERETNGALNASALSPVIADARGMAA